MATTTRVEIKAFDGDNNFSLWKIRIMAQLGVLGLKGTLTDFALTKTETLTKSEEKQVASGDESSDSSAVLTKEVPDPIKIEKSEQAMNIIINHISDTVLRKVNHCKTAATLWELLNELYMETLLPNRIYAQLKFYSFRMMTSKTIDQNVDDFLRIVAELGSLDIKVAEEVQAILILNSLPVTYDQLKHTLKYGNKTLSVKDVVSSSKSLEREMAELKENTKVVNTTLYTAERGRPQTRNQNGSQGNNQGNNQGKNQGKGKSRSNSKSRVTCWFCKKEGHVKKDCFARKKKFENEEQGEAGVITEKLVYSEALSMHDQEAKEKWVIDSGCTYHITSRMDWFTDFNENESTLILLGDDHTVESRGSGIVKINTHGGTIRMLKNVRFVLNLRRNLISTGTLDKLGFKHEGGDGKIRFYKENKTALRGNLVNGLYVLDGHTVLNESCNAEGSTKRTSLWHCRLGHMSVNNMKILTEKGLIEKKDIKELGFCEHCVMGKSKKLSYVLMWESTILRIY